MVDVQQEINILFFLAALSNFHRYIY